jgi:uncharacterized protein YndB with AHSA1/START domain
MSAGGYYAPMSTTRRLVRATPEQVWDVLADGWLYPLWVVGATRMREVDDDWPAVGSRLHHSVGVWPLVVDDDTEVLEAVPGKRLVLNARAWPTGAAGVIIRLDAVGTETEVTIDEDAVAGPARLVPKPLRDLPITWRNVEALRRLAYVAERRSAGRTSAA